MPILCFSPPDRMSLQSPTTSHLDSNENVERIDFSTFFNISYPPSRLTICPRCTISSISSRKLSDKPRSLMSEGVSGYITFGMERIHLLLATK